MESDGNVSENGVDHVTDVSLEKLDKLDPTDRELYEKLKQQEKEERLEIERELKVQEDVLSGLKRHEDIRMRDFRSGDQDLGQDLRVNKSDRVKIEREREDYRSLRENMLKGYSSPAINIYNHPAYLAAMSAATAGYPRSQTPESTTSTTPPLGDGPSHHWTFEEQFKQVREVGYIINMIFLSMLFPTLSPRFLSFDYFTRSFWVSKMRPDMFSPRDFLMLAPPTVEDS